MSDAPDVNDVVIPFDFPFAILGGGYENVKMIDEPLKCKEYFIVDNPTMKDVDVIEINSKNGPIYIKEMPFETQMMTSDISLETPKIEYIDEQLQTSQMTTPPPAPGRVTELFKNFENRLIHEIQEVKSMMMSEQRTRRSFSTDSKEMQLQNKKCSNTDLISRSRSRPNFRSGSMSDNEMRSGGDSTPLKSSTYNYHLSRKQPSVVLPQSAVVKRVTGQHLHLLTPLRSALQPSKKMPQKATRTTGTGLTTPLHTVHSTTPATRKGIKSSGYGQQQQPATIASFRRITPLTRK
ncbi:unnamed protein product [Didymodactylos carnosus]|uniref:Uncharacterized protein n=1 Tax=Didymodactylos carnosus TaxID=1234261 RepID=A0A8S2GP20_9BILA|nr:unnamed protein product [Didymodactylos carnosus]CAF3544861.1 unnamed protein product [Didymodactylos carnosus]